jgi:hypothetical protein
MKAGIMSDFIQKWRLESVFQPQLNKLERLTPKPTYLKIVRLLNLGHVEEVDRLLRGVLSRQGVDLRFLSRWDRTMRRRGGTASVEEQFKKYGPIFNPPRT